MEKLLGDKDEQRGQRHQQLQVNIVPQVLKMWRENMAESAECS